MNHRRIPVYVDAPDPVSRAGVVALLAYRPEVRLLEADDAADAEVVVVVAEKLDDPALQSVRVAYRRGSCRVVLVSDGLDDRDVVTAVEAGVRGILRRVQATPDSLVHAIEAAAKGDGNVPPDLLGRLLQQIGAVQRHVLAPRGLTLAPLTEREREVCRLIADGYSTSEIAGRLAYSERTIKNAVQAVMTRLHLRNRPHLVAYVVREGLI